MPPATLICGAALRQKVHRDWAISGGKRMKRLVASNIVATDKVAAVPLPLVKDRLQGKLPVWLNGPPRRQSDSGVRQHITKWAYSTDSAGSVNGRGGGDLDLGLTGPTPADGAAAGGREERKLMVSERSRRERCAEKGLLLGDALNPSHLDSGLDFRKKLELQSIAAKAIVDADNDERLRRALLRQSHSLSVSVCSTTGRVQELDPK